MEQIFTIKDNYVLAKLLIRIYRGNKFTFAWLDERTGHVVYESQKIKTKSREAVIFIGLISFFAYFEDDKLRPKIHCVNQTAKDWFNDQYIPGIYSYEPKVTEMLINCLDWMKENQERVNGISTPWRTRGRFPLPLRDEVETIDMITGKKSFTENILD